MNASAKTELAAVAATQSAVDAMAVVTLSPEKYAAEVYQPFNERLAAAIEGVKAIDYDIKTTAGMAVAVKARATFRDLRTEADNERKERKAPITKIGKLLESHFDMVEERARPLEVLFDADIQAEIERKEAEKAAKIAAERQRTEAIQADIQSLRDMALRVAGQNSTLINAAIEILEEIDATEARFAEFAPDAAKAMSETIDKLVAMHATALVSEAAVLAAEEARKAEALRIEQERAALAAQRAENERIANEQAKERQRLAALQAAQEAEVRRVQEQATANLRAEREALAERERLADEAQVKAAADLKAAIEAHALEVAAHAAKLRVDIDHAEALEMNALVDAAAVRMDASAGEPFTSEADLARCTATTQAMLTNGPRLPLPESASVRDAAINEGMDEAPSDNEIIDAVMATFGWGYDEATTRMQAIDYAAALAWRAELAA